MNDINFVLHSLKFRQLNSFLSVLLTAFSVSLALLITLFGNHIEERINADGEKIDIVVGAKGSPLQLILSSISVIPIIFTFIKSISHSKSKYLTRSARKIKLPFNTPMITGHLPENLFDNWLAISLTLVSILSFER